MIYRKLLPGMGRLKPFDALVIKGAILKLLGSPGKIGPEKELIVAVLALFRPSSFGYDYIPVHKTALDQLLDPILLYPEDNIVVTKKP